MSKSPQNYCRMAVRDSQLKCELSWFGVLDINKVCNARTAELLARKIKYLLARWQPPPPPPPVPQWPRTLGKQPSLARCHHSQSHWEGKTKIFL